MAMFMNVRNVKTYRERRQVNSKELLRFQNESVDFLTNEFLPERDEFRGGALTSRQKMEILLRFVGDPGFQSGIAEDIGVHRSTVCKTVNFVMDQIIRRANDWIHFPSTAREMNEARVLWQTRFHMPSVIGALDCTHVEINKPSIFGDEYVNRKGYTSINVQATCDASEKVTSISAEWPGSVHDSRIWRRTPFRNILSRFDGSVCLLADSGYGISPWLITPFKPAHTEAQRIFNLHHSQERVVIERVFGQIKRRFPILGNCVRVNIERVPKVIVTCAILHNIAKHLNDRFEFEDQIDDNENIHENANAQDQYENAATRLRGEQKRQEMLEQLGI